MARILGIDFGTKRVGIALSDEEEKMAFPHSVLENPKALEEIKRIIQEEKIAEIALGLPLRLEDMQDTEMTKEVRAFAEELKKIGIPVLFEHEFLSSKEAGREKENREYVDASAAALILQTYLERKRNMIK